MKYIISILLFLNLTNLFGQTKGIVIDKSTEKPIPFANIFIKDQNIGTTSDINGSFRITQSPVQSILIISAIGYETRAVISQEDNSTIELTPRIYELPEFKITSQKHNSKLVIDSFKKNKSKTFVSTGEYPWILTKYFNFLPDYNTTPILKGIQLITSCHLDSAIFNIRLIAADEKGGPGPDLLKSNLIITVKKGENNILVDLTDYRIVFPKNGFYVAVEWLILKQNKIFNNQDQRVHYEPKFGIVQDENNHDILMYSKGQWYKSKLSFNPSGTIAGKLAVELTLTN